MTKFVHADVLDGGLLAIKNNSVAIALISAYTAGDTYATVMANKIAQAAMTAADFTLAASGNNRALTSAAKTATSTAANLQLDSGTATGGTTTTLANTGKAWAVNGFASKAVTIVSGTGAGQEAIVASNTATVLTFPAMATAPDATSVYRINNNLHFAFTDGAAKVLWVTDETSESPNAAGEAISFPALTYTNIQPT